MKKIIALLFVAALFGHPDQVYGIGRNAGHIFDKDGLWGFGDKVIQGDCTRYYPDTSQLPDGVVLNEIYLFLRYKNGQTPGVNQVKEIRYNGNLIVQPKRMGGSTGQACEANGDNDVIRMVDPNDPNVMLLWYGFHDRTTERTLGAGNGQWDFLMPGNDPLSEVWVFVSYHMPGHTNMPDLYMPNGQFPSTNGLLAVESLEQIINETSDQFMTGKALDPTRKNIMVMVHGWNGSVNYTEDPGEVTIKNQFARSPTSGYTGFQILAYRAFANPLMKNEGWQIARYDWHNDSATGLPFDWNFWSENAIASANAARDAASAHGLKLGRQLADHSPTSVHFVAHSAGNWVVKRAAAHLKWRFPSMAIQFTALDPFVNDDDPTSIGTDLDLTDNFALARLRADYVENYYAIDSFSTDLLGWTSGDFDGWNVNRRIESLGIYGLYANTMQTHSGPIEWYAESAASTNLGNTLLRQLQEGFVNSMPLRLWPLADKDAFSGTFTTAPNFAFNWYTYRATKQAGEPNHGGDAGGASLWASWRAPASGAAIVSTAGGNFESLPSVYSGTSVASLSLVAGGTRTNRLSFNAVSGTTYRIAVDGYKGSVGFAPVTAGLVPHYTFTTNQPNTDTITITGYTGPGGEVEIPSTIYGRRVTEIGELAFLINSNITRMVIPGSITKIGGGAFIGCELLESVIMNDGVLIIDEYAFADCDQLTEVVIPESVVSIGEGAFQGCDALEIIEIPDGVVTIGNNAFKDCTWLYAVTLGSSVTTIGTEAFAGSYNLYQIEIPASVTFIGDRAFADIEYLGEVFFRGNAPAIGGANVFQNSNYVTVYHLSSATGWESVFAGRPTAIWDIEERYYYEVNDPVTQTITLTGYSGPGGAIVIPAWIDGKRVTKIGDSAFRTCMDIFPMGDEVGANDFEIGGPGGSGAYVTSVVIPEGVTNIGVEAFACNGLVDLVIPDSVTRIEAYAFQGNFNLSHVMLGDGVTHIGDAAFENCRNLSSVRFGDQVAYMGYNAFRECERLTSLLLPASLAYIGDSAFNGCSRLDRLYMRGNAPVAGGPNIFYATSNQVLLYYLPGSTGWSTMFSGRFTSVWFADDFPFFLSIHDVGPNPVPGLDVPQNFSIIGSNMGYTANVILRDLDTAEVFTGRTVVSHSGNTNLVIRPNFTSASHDWSVQVINGNVFPSKPFRFAVAGGSGTSGLFISGVSPNPVPGANHSQPFTIQGGGFVTGCNVILRDLSTGEVFPNRVISSFSETQVIINPNFSAAASLWSVEVINPDGTSTGPFTFAVATPSSAGFYLSFPLENRTPYSVAMNSVFDHSPLSGTIIAYTGEKGEEAFGRLAANDPSFKQASGANFVANGNYTGGGYPDYLSYDGHMGYDYRTREADQDPVNGRVNVLAAAPGRVRWIPASAYNTIEIDHGNGYATRYLHLYSRQPGLDGTDVARGQIIGVTGDVGSPGAPHLHFEVRRNGTPIDPYGWTGAGADPYQVATGIQNVNLWQTEGQFLYAINSWNPSTITITGYVGSGGALVIPAMIDGLTVTHLGQAAFEYNSSLSSVVFPETLTDIGYWAFYRCGGLKSLYIPGTVTQVWDGAFDSCTGLTSVVIGQGVQKIGDYAFYDCKGLLDVSIASGSIGEFVFDRCTRLRNAELGSGVSKVGLFAFSECTSLTNVTIIGDGNAVIDDWAFSECRSLRTISIGTGVTRLGEWVFSDCDSLESVVFPESVTQLGSQVFPWLPSLVSVHLGSQIDNIPEGLFEGCENLHSVNIPPGVTNIGPHAFNGCGMLTNITLGSHVEIIGRNAFSECFSFTQFVIPSSVRQIDRWAFAYCTGLTNITGGAGVENIGDAVFYSCSRLPSISLGDAITNIGQWAFAFSTNLTGIGISSANPYFASQGGVVFNKAMSQLVVVPPGQRGSYSVPGTVQQINSRAFYSSGYSHVSFPGSVTNIGHQAFLHSDHLRSVLVGDGLARIENNAFMYCPQFEGMYFMGNAPALGVNVFHASNVLTIYYRSGTTGWGTTYGGRPTALWVPNATPQIVAVSPNPVPGANQAQPFTIIGSNFVEGCNVVLRDVTSGEVFANRPISSFSRSQLVIYPNFSTAAHVWSVEVINPDGQSSGAYGFDVAAPGIVPAINSVSPYPVIGSNQSQPFTIRGVNFVEGCNVTLRDLTAGEVFPNRTISSLTSTQLVLQPNFSTAAHDWSVEIINPDGSSSGPYAFAVVSPSSAPAISGVQPNPVVGSDNPQPFVIRGQSFDLGVNVILRDVTTGEIFPNRVAASLVATQIVLNPVFSTAAHQWSVEVITTNGQTSGPFEFSVVAALSTTPVIASVNPNPVTGSNSPQSFTINGNHFVSGVNVILRDVTAGEEYPFRAISSFSSTQIVINPNFSTAAHNWTVEIINPDGQTSGAFPFNVVSPSATRPVISQVSPNPVVGSNHPQPFAIKGENFVSGANVTLRDVTSGEVFTNRTISSLTSTEIVINPNFSTALHTWSVEVMNPDGQSSGAYTFQVVATGELPDLIPQQILVNAASAAPGDTLALSWTLANIGSGSSPSTVTGVRINQSATDGNAAYVSFANIPMPALVGNTATEQSSQIILPSNVGPGTYYAWIIADNVANSSLLQSDYNNDYARSEAFTVTGEAPDRALGIDVAHHQGQINWPAVYAAGIRFAVIKATDGYRSNTSLPMFTDPRFSTNAPAAVAAGVRVGAYHFARPYINSAVAEADHFLSVAGAYVGAGFLPPALDIEDPDDDAPSNQLSLMGKAALSQWIRDWCARVESVTGVKPMLYMTPWFSRNLMEPDLVTYPLWIAYYETSASANPDAMGPWGSSWTFMQYSINGRILDHAIQYTPVDLDAFNGSVATLEAFINGTIEPGPAPVITRVSPNPVIGSDSPQPFTIIGSNFVAGCNVTLRDLTASEVFPNRTISSLTATQIVINPNFSTAAHAWNVEVINPDGQSSGPFGFTVNSSGTEFTVPVWTWMGGTQTSYQHGVYGDLGVPAQANRPGTRLHTAKWTDSSGKLWLFGGTAFLPSGTTGRLNDLWRYDPVSGHWAWMHGTPTGNHAGVYGTINVEAASNMPGTRTGPAHWSDSAGRLWMFGGAGFGSAPSGQGQLNDLWRYNPSTGFWSWRGGSDQLNQAGVYGTFRVADSGNKPGGRLNSVTWTDSSGRLWLFGGYGRDSRGSFADGMNDLWMYDPSADMWTWMHGSDETYAPGVYGTRGVSHPNNTPGARYRASAWRDPSGALWLFGGIGIDSQEYKGKLNDLWKFEPATMEWTWMSGSNVIDQFGQYGEKGIGGPGSVPGARNDAKSWMDSNGDLWLYGGYGYDATDNNDELNDLWRYRPATSTWTWESGSNVIHRGPSVFGVQGIPSVSNIPGSRWGSSVWMSGSNVVWMFGGQGRDHRGWGNQLLGDFWRLDLNVTSVTPPGGSTQSDLVVDGTPLITPDPVAPGQLISVIYTLKNQGPGPAGSSQTKVQIKSIGGALITDPRYDAPALSAGQSIAVTNRVLIPGGTPVGTYAAIVILDNLSQLNQTNEANDVTPGVAFTIGSDLPCDVFVDGTPQVVPASVEAGSLVSIVYLHGNQGSGVAGASQTKVQIKNAAGVTITAPVFPASPLNPGQVLTVTNQVHIPSGVSTGTYSAIVILDNLSELNQTNTDNDFASPANFQVISGAPLPLIRVEPLVISVERDSGVAGSSVKTMTTSSTMDDSVLRLRRGDITADQRTELRVPKRTSSKPPRFQLMQFDRLPTETERMDLEAQGLRILRYVPDNAFWVMVDHAKKEAAAKKPGREGVGLRWAWTPPARYKMSESVERGTYPEYVRHADGTVSLLVMFFEGVDRDHAGQLIALLGGQDVRWTGQQIMVARLPEKAAGKVAELDEVEWVELAPPPDHNDNVTSAQRIRAHVLQSAPWSLTGAGIRMGIWEATDGAGGSIPYAHSDFGNRLFVINTSATAGDHATHVAGTMIGSGVSNANARGMAPAAMLWAYDAWNDTAEMRTAAGLGVRISNHSYSSIVGWHWNGSAWVNMNNSELFGGYTAVASEWDSVVRDTGLLVFKSAGNDRNDGPDQPGGARIDGPYDSIPHRGIAKNILTIGATTDNDGMTSFSSWGPADDGRIKPDLVANGQTLFSTTPNNQYGSKSGTSMSSPSASGATALLLEYFGTQVGGVAPVELIKGLLIHGARDLGRPGPDYEFGWGLIQADASLQLIERRSWRRGTLDAGAAPHQYIIPVSAGATNLKATLIWTDPPGTPGAARALVNDLNLYVEAPDGTLHYPWILDPGQPAAAATRGVNTRDNVEQVMVANPASGDWKVVIGGTVAIGPQAYSLIANDIQAVALNTFVIYNDGTAPLNVTSIARENNRSWLEVAPNGPFTVPAGGSSNVAVTINWNATSAGQNTERLLIYSDDAARSPYPDGVQVNARSDEPEEPSPDPLVINNVAPNPLLGSQGALTLTIDGSGFQSGATAILRSSVAGVHTTSAVTFVSSGRVRVAAVFGTTPAEWTVELRNPGGVSTTPFIFWVHAPLPIVEGISPSSVPVGGAALNLQVSGRTFHSETIVRWNGSDRVTEPLLSPEGGVTGLIAAVTAEDVAATGSVLVTVFSPGPGGGESESVLFTINGNDEGRISDVWVSSGEVGISFQSLMNQMYRVYWSTNTEDWIASDSAVQSADLETTVNLSIPEAPHVYVQVVLDGTPPGSNHLWGIMEVQAPFGYTLVGVPVRGNRRFDEDLGQVLANELTGSDEGIGGSGDQVYLLGPNGVWRMLYLDQQGAWRESSGAPSQYELQTGEAFILVRNQPTTAELIFTGPVGNDGNRARRIFPGWNLISLSEGRSLSLTSTLAAGIPIGGSYEEESDLLILQKTDGSWRRLMFIEGWGAPYDGNWFDISAFELVTSDEVLLPGQAYYYLRRGTEMDVEF